MGLYIPGLAKDDPVSFVEGLAGNFGTIDAHLSGSVSQSGGVHGLEVSEGTFTPYLSDGADIGNYAGQTGVYLRIGSLVWFRIYLSSNHNYGSGTAQLSAQGLPFTPRDYTPATIGRCIGFDIPSTANGLFSATLQPTGIIMFRYPAADGNATTLFPVRTRISQNGFLLDISGVYRI